MLFAAIPRLRLPGGINNKLHSYSSTCFPGHQINQLYLKAGL
jgi:hypothetical protein